MKKYLVFLFLISSGISFSQSRKKQIQFLTNRVDSLNNVLIIERKINNKKTNQITSLSAKIVGLENEISNLNKKISTLEVDKNELNTKVNGLTNELTTNKTNLTAKDQELSGLQAELNAKTDSLEIMRAELTKLKPAPKPVVTSNTNTNNSNQSTQTSQTGGYKFVKIGTQTWMTENLNVSTFRNGDLIPEAKSEEEWKRAGENNQPAWCYYDNDPKNGTKYGKLYNWYAVNDSRGLAPAGWHVPTDAEWTTLSDYLGNEPSKKMKSTNGWNGWEEDLICQNCKVASAEYKKICSVCKGTGKNGKKKAHAGNGTNSSGFSGLPGGCRYYNGGFSGICDYGFWWSSTENSASAYYRLLVVYGGSLGIYYNSKGEGLSVRCLRD
jgi:uncharacterized protein (TIGR02145 family)